MNIEKQSLLEAAKAVVENWYQNKAVVDSIEALLQAVHRAVQEAGIPLTPPSVDALIAEAIKEHDAKNLLIKSVNLRTQAQPYLDELIAEIDGLERIDFDEGGCDYPCSDGDNYRFDDVRAVINKYRSAK